MTGIENRRTYSPRRRRRLVWIAVMTSVAVVMIACVAYAVLQGGDEAPALGPWETCQQVAPVAAETVLLSDQVHRGQVSETQRERARDIEQTLADLARTGHKPWRGDIGVLRQAAASVNGAEVVSPITTREARNRILLNCRDYR